MELGLAVVGGIVAAVVLGRIASRLPRLVVVAFVLGLSAAVGLQRPASTREPAPTHAATDGSIERPNLLLLVWDTTRAKSLSTYGYDRATTPVPRDLAERATVFEEARSVSSFTYTSHLSMLTGVYPSHHGGRLTRMTYDPDRTPSVARLLADAGYRTGAFVGTGVLRANTGMVEGFEVFDDRVDPAVCDTQAWKLVHDVQAVLAKVHPAFRGNGNPHWFETFQRPASQVLTNTREWIEADDPRPWFCMVNLYDVHWPYLPRGEGREKFVRPYDGPVDGYLFRSDDYHLPAGTRKGALLSEVDDRHLTDLYDAEMYDLDREVAEFLQAVETSDPGRETALILTSDHGEAFGEDDAYGHHGVLEAQVRIPMLLVHPGGEPGRAAGRVSGVDVATTLLSIAGVEAPVHMTGAGPHGWARARPRRARRAPRHVDAEGGAVFGLQRDLEADAQRRHRLRALRALRPRPGPGGPRGRVPRAPRARPRARGAARVDPGAVGRGARDLVVRRRGARRPSQGARLRRRRRRIARLRARTGGHIRRDFASNAR